MKDINNSSEASDNAKRVWSAPKVIRRASVDRTQGGSFANTVENVNYNVS